MEDPGVLLLCHSEAPSSSSSVGTPLICWSGTGAELWIQSLSASPIWSLKKSSRSSKFQICQQIPQLPMDLKLGVAEASQLVWQCLKVCQLRGLCISGMPYSWFCCCGLCGCWVILAIGSRCPSAEGMTSFSWSKAESCSLLTVWQQHLAEVQNRENTACCFVLLVKKGRHHIRASYHCRLVICWSHIIFVLLRTVMLC